LTLYTALLIILPAGVFFVAPAEIQYQVTERYTFSADQTGMKINLAVMIPRDNPYQQVNSLEITWDGEVSREVFGEVEVIKLTGKTLQNQAVLEYDVTLPQGSIEWEAIPKHTDVLPQKVIESSAPMLRSEALKVCSNPSTAGYDIYQFVSSYLSWPDGTRLGKEKSALAAYHSRTGVCGEFANLMTAFSRACDKPARSIQGIAMPLHLPPLMTVEKIWMHPGGAHAWD